jgi:hypothetical protein
MAPETTRELGKDFASKETTIATDFIDPGVKKRYPKAIFDDSLIPFGLG